MDDTLSEMLEKFISDNKINLEMNTDGLEKVCEAIGYKGDMFGNVLENFLRDNSGAQQAIVDWIGEQESPEWKENLESMLEEDEDDEDNEDEEESLRRDEKNGLYGEHEDPAN